MTAQTRGSGHDWDDARKAALFARIVGLELSIEEAARLHGLRVDVIQEWLRLFRRSALLAFDERLKKTLIDQGANADALAAAEFTGHVEDVSISDLVQTIEIAGKDAVITVTHEGQDHRMWCSAGAIIDASSGRLSGEAAAYRILAFERGRMVADLRPELRERTIYAATHRLLLEAMRRKDESAPLLARLGDVERHYRLGDRSTSARVHVSTDELSVLRLFDSPRRLGDVLAQSQLGDFETLSALARLVDNGYLIGVDLASLRPQAARPAAARPETVRGEGQRRAPIARPPARAEIPRAETPRGAGPRRTEVRRSEAPRSGAAGSDAARARASRCDAARAARAARRTEPRRSPVDGPGQRAPSSSGPSDAGARRPSNRAAVAAERPERPEPRDPPSSAPASFMPISISRPPPERGTLSPRWVFAAMAAAVLAPAAFWFGETMSNLQATRRTRAHADPAPMAAAARGPSGLGPAAAATRSTFEVTTRVEPATAIIWLDHHPVASGRLEITLPKDGRTHELRAAADGYVPITLMFADVAPPREIQLEPLLAAAPGGATRGASSDQDGSARAAGRDTTAAAPSPSTDTAASLMPASHTAPARVEAAALGARPRSAPARARPRAAGSSAAPAPAAPPLAQPEEPRVQIIDPDAPRIQVIE